jgi:hypothetical protein
MDLLTTYTHDSELQVITALSLISTLYKSPQHPLSLFAACCVFISCYVAATSNSGDFSAPCPQVDSTAPTIFLTTTLHGPSRKHRFQQHLCCCVRIRCSGNVFTEPLPRNGLHNTVVYSPIAQQRLYTPQYDSWV